MLQKYSKDGEFTDPIVRCCECSNIIVRKNIGKFGGCPKCGNRRVRNVLNMTDEEMDSLRNKGIDEEFLSLFEGVSDV
jgi:predicted  nucleic acid-binding Zn-ribbon protein